MSNCTPCSPNQPSSPTTPTYRQLQANCGCATPTPVQPENLTAVPAGSMIVQAPCADACLPPNSAAPGLTDPAADASCAGYNNPCVKANFTVPDIGATGQMIATCASNWALPGMLMYFSVGHLEVIGVSGEVITYKNRTVPFGTQILEGICFGYGVPPIANEAGEGDDSFGDPSSTLDRIYGENDGVRSVLEPVDGTQIVACGGKWQRQTKGLQLYPHSPFNQLVFNSNRISYANRTWNITLPGYPAGWECGLGTYALLQAEVQAWWFDDDDFANPGLALNNIHVGHQIGGYKRGKTNTNMVVIPTPTSTLTINLIKRNNDKGDMQGIVWLMGYYY